MASRDSHAEGERRLARSLYTGAECTPLEFDDARRPLVGSVATLMLSVALIGCGLAMLVYASALLSLFK